MTKAIQLSHDDTLNILLELEFIILSLRNIGRYYAKPVGSQWAPGELAEYYRQTCLFIDQEGVNQKLAAIRRQLSMTLDDPLSEEEQLAIDSAFEQLPVWTQPQG